MYERLIDFRQSRCSKPRRGEIYVAQGKRDSWSAPPWVDHPKHKPLTDRSRDSANLICGPLVALSLPNQICVIHVRRSFGAKEDADKKSLFGISAKRYKLNL